MPKRQATVDGSVASDDEGGHHGPPSPSPALSVSALNYTDEEDVGKSEKQRASTTPKADNRPQERTNERKVPHMMAKKDPGEGHRGGSPMKVSTPNPKENTVRNGDDPDDEDPELWFETTDGDITTNGKGLHRTATPPGGWPRVYLAANPAFNIAAETLNDWENVAEPTVWARLYRARYKPTEAGKMRTGDMIKNVIKKLVYVRHDESVAVIFPEQDLPPKNDNRYPHPYHLLVVGLEPQQAQRLLDLEVVATREATIFFLPRNPPRSLYILTMKGLTYNDTEGARELVEDLARRTFQMSPEIRAIIENHADHLTEEELDHILDVRASFLPLKQRANVVRCWNLYFTNDPGFKEEEYKTLRKKMRACVFKTLTFGKGHGLTRADEQPICTGCKSTDHDSYNCPFSRLPGWLGYRPSGPGFTAGTTDFVDEEQYRARTYQTNTFRRGRYLPRNRGGFTGGRGTGYPQRGRGRT